jgi:hypothetical protein
MRFPSSSVAASDGADAGGVARGNTAKSGTTAREHQKLQVRWFRIVDLLCALPLPMRFSKENS